MIEVYIFDIGMTKAKPGALNTTCLLFQSLTSPQKAKSNCNYLEGKLSMKKYLIISCFSVAALLQSSLLSPTNFFAPAA